jgi:hypothetical protein
MFLNIIDAGVPHRRNEEGIPFKPEAAPQL